jgi:Arc/MetJ-type ribon-helix-helix transcriptional regulator
MKTITINVSEPIYAEFQEYAKRRDRTTSELIREAMEAYRERWAGHKGSLRDLKPLDLGLTKQPLTEDDDTLGEMLD